MSDELRPNYKFHFWLLILVRRPLSDMLDLFAGILQAVSGKLHNWSIEVL